MSYIENESEYKKFMKRSNRLDDGSMSTYLSRLNYIAKNGVVIDYRIQYFDNDNILNIVKINEKKPYKDIGSLKTAINSYREFLLFYVVREDLKNIEGRTDIPETTKKRLVDARLGQGKFRTELIKIWKKCSISQLENEEVLVASHILPWRHADDQQRLDPYNGLLLQPNFDKLFDYGYISFKGDGSIILSKKLSIEEYKKLGINNSSRLFKMFSKNIPYLEKHEELYKEILLDLHVTNF